MSLKYILLILIILQSCSHTDQNQPMNKADLSNFSEAEIILSTSLLSKIYDKEISPLQCVPDQAEAALLLRTIRPRMEYVQDNIEAMLDNAQGIDSLIKQCQSDCSCYFMDEIFREHQIELSKDQKAKFNPLKSNQNVKACFDQLTNQFCQSHLYQTLSEEKIDFNFE